MTTAARNFKQLVLLLAWTGLVSTAFAKSTPVEARGSLEAVIPPSLKSLQIDRPYVDFMIDVGADGTLFDVMPIESNHRDLLPAAHKVMQSVTFIPATKDGEPIRKRTKVRVHFFDPEQRVWRSGASFTPFGDTPSDAAKRRIYANSAKNYVYKMSKRDELDSPITQRMSTRRVYSSQHGVATRGRCLVEFYIGPNGRARFPRAIETDSNDVAISAALTLLETQFEPPRRNGQPTYVKIQQEFEFN
ncbi:MAG: hypothetical protein SynsKO_07500 [Synoicihabitans sp.]